MSAMRALVAYLPAFALELEGWEPHQRAVVVEPGARGELVVTARTHAAGCLGVRVGQALAEARGVCPGLAVVHNLPQKIARELFALEERLQAFRPPLRALAPCALAADVPADLDLGGEERLVAQLSSVLKEVAGCQSRIVIAANVPAALGLALHVYGDVVVPSKDTAAALAPLPLAAIHLRADKIAWLEGLGVRTVGAFAALPEAVVTARDASLAVHHWLARGAQPAEAFVELLAPPPPRHDTRGLLDRHSVGLDLAKVREVLEAVPPRDHGLSDWTRGGEDALTYVVTEVDAERPGPNDPPPADTVIDLAAYRAARGRR